MINRRGAMLVVASLALPASALAGGMMQFASANFAAARDAGGPIVVHVDATWCPTCRAQKPVLAKLLAEPKYSAFRGFAVDYDSEKAVMRELAAPDRSTILVFSKGREVARSVGQTSEDTLALLLDKAL